MGKPKDPWLHALCFLLGALAMYRPIYDMDAPLHLSLGRWMLQEGRLPLRDPLSFLTEKRDWIDHEWLAQLFMGISERFLGIEGLKIAAALVVGLGTLVFFRAFRSRGLSRLAALGSCLLLLWLFETRLRLRPHLLTFLGAGLLLGAPPLPWSRRRCLLSLAFFLCWVNGLAGWLLVPLHFAGLLLCSLLLGGAWKPPALALSSSLCLALANPWGYRLCLSPLRISRVSHLIEEWRSPLALGRGFELKGGLSLALATLAAFLLLRAFLGRRRQGDPGAAHALAPLCWGPLLGLGSQRFLFLGTVVLPRTRRLLGRRGAPVLLALSFLCLLPGQGERWLHLLRSEGGRAFIAGRFPEAAAAEAARRGLGGRVFCPPTWAGYLQWRLGPGIKTALDGRVELFSRIQGRALPAFLEAFGAGTLKEMEVDLLFWPRGGGWGPHFRRIFEGPLAELWMAR